MKHLLTYNEKITINIKKGDTVLGGRFKNKKVIVKKISKNKKGDICINGKPLLRFRIVENLSKEESKQFQNFKMEVDDLDYILSDEGVVFKKFFSEGGLLSGPNVEIVFNMGYNHTWNSKLRGDENANIVNKWYFIEYINRLNELVESNGYVLKVSKLYPKILIHKDNKFWKDLHELWKVSDNLTDEIINK